jgi:hypothetical protein
MRVTRSFAPRVIVCAAVALSSVGIASCGFRYGFSYRGQAGVFAVPKGVAHASTCDRTLPDVTAALQQWVNTLPHYAHARLGSRQCYHVEYPLTIGATTGVVFDGNGSTFASFSDGCEGTRVSGGKFANCKYPPPVDSLGRTDSDWPRHRYHLRLMGNVDLTVTNLHIEGGKDRPGYDPDYAFQHGIWITSRSDGTVLDNITIDHVWGDYLNFGRHIANGTVKYPQHVTVQNSRFGLDAPRMGTGRQGVSIGDGADLNFRHNVFQYSSRSAVDIEPVSSNNLLRDIHFEHNTFGPHGNNLFANHPYGGADPVIDGIYFRYNTLKGTGLGVDSVVADVSRIDEANPSTYRRHHYEFVGNVADTMTAKGTCPGPNWSIRLYGIDGLVIRNNSLPLGPNRCMTLIDGAKLRNSRISDNFVLNGIRMASRYYQSSNYCERNNYSSNPLKLDTNSLAPRCAS